MAISVWGFCFSLQDFFSRAWLPISAGWALLGAVVLYVCVHYIMNGTNYPGPHYWPFVGTLPFIALNLENLHDEVTKYAARSDSLTFISKACGLNDIITANPEIIEYILKTNFQNYPKGPTTQETFQDLLGHGIFNSDDELWIEQRKTASLALSSKSLRHFLINSVAKEVSHRLLPTLRQAMETKEMIDIQDVLLRYTFDSICHIGFGVDPGCLAPGLPDVPFAKAFDTATAATTMRNLFPNFVWKFLRLLQCGWEGELTSSVKAVHEFADRVIEKRLKELADVRDCNEGDPGRHVSNSKLEEHSDLLSRFIIFGQRKEAVQYSSTRLRDVCTNFILAGRDTSSVALTWFFWLLTCHRHIEDKIVAEINCILAARSADERNRETFTFDELRSMHYLHAAISESLRLYPPVPADTKFVLENDTLPDGSFAPKGWRMTYSIYALGRMTKVWGPDATEFRPERWIGNDGKFQAESPFKFLAFNAGPRLCLGRELAYLQMKSVAAVVLQNFRLDIVPGHIAKYRPSLTLFMKYGLLVKLHPRLPVQASQ